MQHTDQKNGVLIYLALTDRKFAILGDSGINERVPANFWDSERDLMKSYFIKNQIAQGLAAGIEQVGQQLKAYFPHRTDDQNELSDDISFG
ncbi:MAG: TPM domain-containing protein [Runella sp.]